MTNIPMTTDYVDVKVKIGAVEFTNEELQIDSIKISNGCYDGSVFGVGNVYIKNANITMNYRGGITKGITMEISFLHLGMWRSFGQFIVKETPVMSGEKISVSLESVLGQKMSTSVVFGIALQKYSLRQIKSKIEEIIGRTIVFVPDLTEEEITSFLDGKSACFLKNIQNYVDQSAIDTGISVRDMLSGLAILFGGNVYENIDGRIMIKQKTYSENSDKYVSSDYLDSNYKYSQETYAISTISLDYLPWSIGRFWPPNATGEIDTLEYLGENTVRDLLLGGGGTVSGYTGYDYVVRCDWIGWTNNGSTFSTIYIPGGRALACLRQGGLYYKTCEMTFVGIDFGWNIAPGNLVKVKVPELDDPIDVLCGEISYEWDGGFTTSISCNCNIESNGSYSTQVSTQASAAAAQEGRQTSLELNYANITLSNIEDSTIKGSIFKDGTIEGSKIKESTITGSLIADSTIKGSNIEEGTITNSLIKDGSITDSVFEDGTISGSKIKESTITGSLIADSAITESKISNSSITNSKIKDATLTGAKIKDATIGFEKVDKSFISDLTADDAYIENLKASIADIGYLTADEADIKYLSANEADIKYATIDSLAAADGKIDDLETIAITTNNLSAKVADLGYLNVDTADLKYANIELSNIDVANVGTLFANVGLIDRATIIDGHITGFLDSVEVNANKITAGTLIADRILLKGSEDGLLYALNNLGELTSTTVDTLDGYVLTDRTINADKIVASSITANELDVDNIFADSAVVTKIFAQNITATGTIKGVTLVGASVSADRGTIGGFGIFDNSLMGSYDDNTYHHQVELSTDKTYGTKNGAYAISVRKDNKSTNDTENEWYVTYDGYMHAEIGEIAGFTLQDQKMVANSEYTPENASATYYYGATINSKFNQEADFLTLTCTVNNTETNKVVYGLGGVQLETNGYDYYDKFMSLSDRSLTFGVNSGTPYNGNAIAFKIDSGYSAITSSGKFTINPSCTINVPTTVNNSFTANSMRSKTGIAIYHTTKTPYIDFYNASLGTSGVTYGYRIISNKTNALSFISGNGSTILALDSSGAYESSYRLVGCTVTTSGNFTCKKYRDGRLIIEYRKKLTSNTGLTSSSAGAYFANDSGGTFPTNFTDTPSVIGSIGMVDLSSPFCNITFDGVSTTGWSRTIFWTTLNATTSIKSGSVVSATFTGKWK